MRMTDASDNRRQASASFAPIHSDLLDRLLRQCDREATATAKTPQQCAARPFLQRFVPLARG